MSERKQVKKEDVDKAFQDLRNKLDYRLVEKSNLSFGSRHEILGVLQEEMHELVEAVCEHDNREEICNELLDIAVGALFGYICHSRHYTDW